MSEQSGPTPPPGTGTSDTPASPSVVLRPIRLPAVKPVWSYVLMVANVLVYGVTLAFGNLPDGTPLLFALGWKDSACIVAGEYWRLVTPIFLHGGPVHLLFNTYALYVLGPQVERVFGYARFILIYLLSGIAGVVAGVAFRPAVHSVGASGALFGLIGALIVYLHRHRELFGRVGRHRLISAVHLAVINLLIGLAPLIDNWGHVGGLIGGAAFTWALGPRFVVQRPPGGVPLVEDRMPLATRWWAVSLSCAALVALTALAITLSPALSGLAGEC